MTQQIDNRLIAFTGPDGIGKTTQCKLLVEWINSEEYKEQITSVKECFEGEYIKELNDSDYISKAFRNLVYCLYKQVDVVTLANLIQLNRYVLQDQINYQHSQYYHKLTIVDRWNICTYCYIKASGVDQVLAASYLTDEHTIIPGLTIMLVGMNGATRTANRENNNNMFEDIGNDFNLKLAQTYMDFNTDLYAGKVVKINNDELKKEETQDIIRQIVLDYLKTY